MSERVVSILKEHCADIEVYSIDESFLKLSFFQATKKDLFDFAFRLRSTILRGTGIPVSIGIAKTKTLSKLANHIAKKRTTEGVYILEAGQAILETIDISKVWGIGRAYLKRLNQQNIQTVQQLSSIPEQWMKKEFGIVGLRLLKEIQGFPCYQLEDEITQRKNTMVSRSFKSDIYALDQLKEKVATYATRLGEKLRQYEQVTATLTLYLWVNRYKNKRTDGRSCFTRTLELPLATSNTNELITYAHILTELLYQKKTNYKKAGILASTLRPQQMLQTNLFHSKEYTLRSQKLMTAMDGINKKLGRNTVHFAALGTGQQHLRPTANFKSPCYTTNWAELLKVR
jgi:DNA polymerase V